MVTRTDLAISYLLAVGIGFLAVLTLGLLYPAGPSGFTLDSTIVFALFCGVLIAFGFLVSGVVLARNPPYGARASRIAIWGTAGLGVPSLVILSVMSTRAEFVGLGWEQVAMLSIAGGGILGILSGTLVELQTSHARTWRLNQRNTVYLRMFRHDIRNSVNIIQGHLELMREGRHPPAVAIPTINDQLDHIVHLSDAAQTLEELEDMTSTDPVDLAALTQERLDELQRANPRIRVRTDIHPPAYVSGNCLLTSVVENVLRNTVDHHPGDPTVEVTIRPDEDDADCIVLRIEDDGPGFSAEELELYSQGFETDLHHSDGIGLWLAQWIVESLDGTLSIETTATGSLVSIRLPKATEEPTIGTDEADSAEMELPRAAMAGGPEEAHGIRASEAND